MTKTGLIVLAAGLAIGGTLLAQPRITSVTDPAGYTRNLAQGSLFVVKGTDLSGPGYTPAPGLPLEATLAGVRITFTRVGATAATDAFLHYTYNMNGVNQLSAVLPSSLAPGDYDVRVINRGATSFPSRSTVVAHNFRIFTQDSSGRGNAVVQNYISPTRYDVNRLTSGTLAGSTITHSPSHPGQTIVIWGLGLGKVVSGPDNVAPGGQDMRSRSVVTVMVGGISIAPDYAGRVPEFPGVDEIVLTLPANVPTGCAVSLQVSVDGQLSNPTTLAIAPVGGDACVSSTYSRDTLIRLDQGVSITIGKFVLTSLDSTTFPSGLFGVIRNERIEYASGGFSQFTGAQFAQLAAASTFTNEPGTCQVSRGGTGGSGVPLDAGNVVTLFGPNVQQTNNQLKNTANSYSLAPLNLTTGLAPIIGQGTYMLTGTGGAGIGAFTAGITLGPPLMIGRLPFGINRSQPLNVTWSGGSASDLVQIEGRRGGDVFFCTTANTGSFTVPASVLGQLPPADTTSGVNGTLAVYSSPAPSTSNGLFTAPLVGGGIIDTGVFLGVVGSMTAARYN